MKSFEILSKFLVGIGVFLFLFQGCAIYQEENVSVEKAVESNSKLKLKIKNSEVYKFHELEKDNENLYGIVRKNSKTAEELAADIINNNYAGKFVKIAIPENSIEEIRLKYPALSTLLPAVGALITTATAFMITLILFIK